MMGFLIVIVEVGVKVLEKSLLAKEAGIEKASNYLVKNLENKSVRD
jgi:hypothetical protein